jgi:hypothetical protein
MGTYNKWYVAVNAFDAEVISRIKSVGRQLDVLDAGADADDHWDDFCFEKWSISSKYDPTPLIQKISKEFPSLIFSISYKGGYGTGKNFIYQGEEIEEKEVFPRPEFPFVSVLKKAIKAKNEKTLIAKEASAKQKRIKELEAELTALKNQKNPLSPVDWSGQHG